MMNGFRLLCKADRKPDSERAQTMFERLKDQLEAMPQEGRWRLRDWIAAAGLFLATAAVVLWQDAHLVVLWDLSYTLDSSVRFALGQMPYRDFPFVHPPLTYLIQAAIVRLTGRVYWHHVVYAAVVGGLGTVLSWRVVLRTLRRSVAAAWTFSVLLAAPLAALGIYSILPLPSYDCDSAFSILVAILLLQRLTPNAVVLNGHDFSRARSAEKSTRALAPEVQPSAAPVAGINSLLLSFAAGTAVALPVFFKQNIGLPLLAVAVAVILLMIAARLIGRPVDSRAASIPCLLTVLAGAATTVLTAALLIQSTAGIGNYLHWTIRFAMERRMPGFKDMLAIYLEPSLLWALPCVGAALLLMRSRWALALWARLLALALLAAPFLFTLFALFLSDDADDRAGTLLAVWPLVLILSLALTLFYLARGRIDRVLIPAALLAGIHGTLLSQQLWGSTYAIWPLLVLLVAEMIAFLASLTACGENRALKGHDFSRAANAIESMLGFSPRGKFFSELDFRHNLLAPALAAVISATLLVCGGLYTASEDRLSFIDLPDGPVMHSTLPQLKGMATPGPYLPDFEELLRFAAANIPASDGLILLPGEDPFYFATGRAPQFPILLFDPATDPYLPAQTLELARTRNIRWLIVKRELQIKADVTPQREATMKVLLKDFKPYTRLKAYDVYRR
jgi:hypothetical protein